MTDAVPFTWQETRATVDEIAARHGLCVDGRSRAFVARDGAVRVVPPQVLPIARYGVDPATYSAALPSELGRHLVVLLQAGAAALGTFEEGVLCRHKVIKHYVTRGRGKAQPTYLKSKGKSREGSRLRLRNARRSLEEVSGRLGEWLAADIAYDLLFYSCPPRLWGDLRRVATPAWPFANDEFIRIARDVAIPGLDELQRAYRSCLWGRVEQIS